MFEQVEAILKKHIKDKEIKPESKLIADLGLSSFDLISVVTDFEDEFDIEVADRDIHKFVTVNDIIEYLEKNA